MKPPVRPGMVCIGCQPKVGLPRGPDGFILVDFIYAPAPKPETPAKTVRKPRRSFA